MTSYPRVIRSLSADELASSLTRTDRLPLHTAVDPRHPTIRNHDHKHKHGLLKRLRKIFRFNTQNGRPSHHDKGARHELYDQYRDHSHPFVSEPVNISPKLATRSRTWRGSMSSRFHSNHEPNESSHSMHSAGDVGLGHSKDIVDATSVSSSEKSLPTSSGHSTFSARNLPRSLPKRVFSSPPSFSARTFGFGSRKRNNSNSKSSHPNSATVNNGLTEGELNGIKRLNRSLAARTSLYESRGSMNLSTLSPVVDSAASSPERSAAAFREVIDAAAAGKVPFTTLLDAMYRLEERLVADVKDTLIKYLSRQESIEALIDKLTAIAPSRNGDERNEKPIAELERYRYSYVSCTLLSTGPIQLRKSLFLNPRHLDRLVNVLGFNTPSDPVVVRSVCRVLLSVLRDSPEDTVRSMVKRKDFVNALLSHIAVTGCPEVCLSMLSTVRCQAELKFGPCNKPIVGVMADAQLMDALCDKLVTAAEKGPLNACSSSTIENCSRVIVGLALRVLVIPKYEIDNEDSDDGYMMKFNRDLESLDVFADPGPILRLLDSGITSIYSHDSRGYALSTALTAVRYLLVTALKGQDSSLSTIRMQLLSVNTEAYEAGVRARIPKLAKILEHARTGAVVETMWEKVENPLGVVRLKVLELIIVLLQHGTEATATAIAKAEVPRILISLFVRLKHNSLLQHFVSAIIELVFTGPFPYLRRAFLIDLRILDSLMLFWDDTSSTNENTSLRPTSYTGELMRMISVIHDFLQRDDMESREYRQGISSSVLQKFELFFEGPVTERLKETGTLLYDPGDLPARPSDDLNIDGYGSIGSRGALFLRPRDSSPMNS